MHLFRTKIFTIFYISIGPIFFGRCVAVSSVAIFLYGELTHGTLHPKMKEAINVLLGALMVSLLM